MIEHLTPEELGILTDVLHEYLGELRMEIADTEDFDFRSELKRKSGTLQMIIGKIEKSKPEPVN